MSYSYSGTSTSGLILCQKTGKEFDELSAESISRTIVHQTRFGHAWMSRECHQATALLITLTLELQCKQKIGQFRLMVTTPTVVLLLGLKVIKIYFPLTMG